MDFKFSEEQEMWRKTIEEFVESIPIHQTKRYIKKVCHSYEIYRFAYKG